MGAPLDSGEFRWRSRPAAPQPGDPMATTPQLITRGSVEFRWLRGSETEPL